MAEPNSPGHKLGQMIGNFFEEVFAEDIIGFCRQNGFYCDRKGPRPAVRGRSRKVSWTDKKGNKHDLDYVVEKGGSYERQGVPVAFVELAWRRYTKHSRNKTGEIEGSLLHLRDSYRTCRFLGAIIAGEYTAGGKKQLSSHGIVVLHVPFDALVAAFETNGIALRYPKDAAPEHKMAIIRQWQALGDSEILDIKEHLRQAIAEDYLKFKQSLADSLLREIESVRVMPLYGVELVFTTVSQAIESLSTFRRATPLSTKFVKFEVQLRYHGGDRIEGIFHSRDEAIRFLRSFV